MKNIKVIVFDIDGTLIARGKETIEESSKEAIRQLKEKGYKIIVATGRASYFIQPDVVKTIHPDFYVTVNGQIVTDHSFNTLFAQSLDLDESNALLKACRKNNIGIGNKSIKNVEVYNDYEHFWPIYVHGNEKLQYILTNTEDIKEFTLNNLPYGLFMIGDENIIKTFEPLLDKLQLSHAYHNAYEAFDKSIGKSDGIDKVLEHYGLSWDETMVFGDANNDIHMFEKAAISVCMGNGATDAKEAAHYVTTQVTDDGILNALKHFNIL